MSKTKSIVIIGNIASGKSTAINILVKALQCDRIDADDLFQTSDPFAQEYLQDMNRWALANELWLTLQRVKIIREHHAKPKSGVTLVDSGLLMSWVYTYGHFLNKVISKDEWELYEDLYTELANDDLKKCAVIRLKYSAPTLLKRLKQRGRGYELKYYTEQYLNQIEDGISALEKKLKESKIPLLIIDESDVADFESSLNDKQQLIQKVEQFIM